MMHPDLLNLLAKERHAEFIRLAGAHSPNPLLRRARARTAAFLIRSGRRLADVSADIDPATSSVAP
jgi:hypothetical protein